MVVLGAAAVDVVVTYPRGVVEGCWRVEAGMTCMSPAYKEVYPMLEGIEDLAGFEKVAARPEDE